MDKRIDNPVPNGGFGWVIVGAVALINMTNQSILSVFGLLFGGQLEKMQQETFMAALIINLNSLALNFSGLFIGPAIKNFLPRNVAASGCLLVSLGLVICAFATEGCHFIIGYSFFVGIGLGLISPSTFMAINSYFTTKRGRAVGVSLAGAGLGQVIIPHIVRYFLDNHGFRTAVLSMAMLSLIGLFGAFLLKPFTMPALQKHNNCQHIKPLLEISSKNVNKDTKIEIFKAKDTNCTPTERSSNSDIQQNTQNKHKKLCSKICHTLIQAFDLDLLCDPIFWSIIIGMALVYTSTINFTMIYPIFLQTSVGLDKTNTAFCMSVIAGADILCRLLLPCITDKLKIPYRVVFLLGTVGLFVARAALAESVTMPSIIMVSIFIGISKSATVLSNNLAISGHCNADKLAGGLGLNMIAKGLLVITVGQFLGWIRDYTNSYIICLQTQNALLLIVIIVWTPEILYRLFQSQKLKKQQTLQSECDDVEPNDEIQPVMRASSISKC